MIFLFFISVFFSNLGKQQEHRLLITYCTQLNMWQIYFGHYSAELPYYLHINATQLVQVNICHITHHTQVELFIIIEGDMFRQEYVSLEVENIYLWIWVKLNCTVVETLQKEFVQSNL